MEWCQGANSRGSDPRGFSMGGIVEKAVEEVREWLMEEGAMWL